MAKMPFVYPCKNERIKSWLLVMVRPDNMCAQRHGRNSNNLVSFHREYKSAGEIDKYRI